MKNKKVNIKRDVFVILLEYKNYKTENLLSDNILQLNFKTVHLKLDSTRGLARVHVGYREKLFSCFIWLPHHIFTLPKGWLAENSPWH